METTQKVETCLDHVLKYATMKVSAFFRQRLQTICGVEYISNMLDVVSLFWFNYKLLIKITEDVWTLIPQTSKNKACQSAYFFLRMDITTHLENMPPFSEISGHYQFGGAGIRQNIPSVLVLESSFLPLVVHGLNDFHIAFKFKRELVACIWIL